MSEDKKKAAALASVSPLVRGFAGSIGGVAEACALQPIDVIKTRLQLDTVGKYRGIAHCGRTIAAEEGTRALWKGLTPFATHLTFKYALRMGSNSVYQVRRKLTPHKSDGRHNTSRLQSPTDCSLASCH